MVKTIQIGLLLALAFGAGSGGARAIPNSSATTNAAAQSSSQAVKPSVAAQSGQLKNLLQHMFLEIARVQDLLSVAESGGPNSAAAAQSAAVIQQADSVRAELSKLEQLRYAWLYNLDSADDGGRTISQLRIVVQKLQELELALKTNGPSSPLQKASADLAATEAPLQAQLSAMSPGRFSFAVQPEKQAAPIPAKPARTLKPASTVAKTAPAPVVKRAPTAAIRVPATAQPKPETALSIAPPELKDLLSKIYLDSARINDLMSLVRPAAWKMNEADRMLLQEKLSSLQSQMETLERARYGLFYDPQNGKLAAQTSAALQSTVPEIRAIATAVGEYDSAADAARLEQPALELAAAEKRLNGYSEYLSEKAEHPLALTALPGGAGLQTEQISSPAPAPPPLKTITTFTPPMTPAQVKAILYQMYISEFRIRDLLGQENPQRWKASKAEKALASQALQNLITRIAELEMWRSRLNQDTANTYDAFELFRSVDQVFLPLRVFASQVDRYRTDSAAGSYRRRANDLEENLNSLMPYFSAILKHASDQAGMIQADLDTCQNQLTYAMRASLRPPSPVRNVLPVFEGRRAREQRKKADRP